MLTPSPLTDKMLAYAAVPDFDFNEAVEWALGMLLHGYDTPSLLILAGLSKPVDQWEARSYLEAAGRELNLSFEEGAPALLRYARYLLRQLAAGQGIGENLTNLHSLLIGTEHEPLFRDFSLLRWAWYDFDFGETYSVYWPAATPATIERLTLMQAQQWLAEHPLNDLH